MNNYILSIDPGLSESGFVLGEKIKIISECEINYREIEYLEKGQPVGTDIYNFKNFKTKTSLDLKGKIRDIIVPDFDTKPNNTYPGIEKFNIYIERGFHNQNRLTTERLDCLRGNIFGLFNKLYIPKEHGISPKEGRCWYKITQARIEFKGTKGHSIALANILIVENNGNIDIQDNHNLAEALLIGGYAINKSFLFERKYYEC